MQKHKNKVLMAILVSETSHIFCCVLPVIFSVVSFLSGIGLVSVMPAGWVQFHDLMHHWELPVIIFSAAMLALGWGLHMYSNHIDCHDTGCCHKPCATKKNKVHILLQAATLLFFINVLVFTVFHRGLGFFAPFSHVSQEQIIQKIS